MKAGHISELDGLRAIAVGLVVWNHFAPTELTRFASFGWIGVDLFFVLSGFLITRILAASRAKADYYRSFYIRRSLRIFPLYYAVLLILFVTGQYAKLEHWGSPLWSWLYLGNVQMAVLGAPPLFALVPFWSLHVEEQFYLLFPVFVRHVSTKTLTTVLLACVGFSPLLRCVLVWWQPDNPYLEYMLLPCRLEGLALGALIALHVDKVRIAKPMLGMLTVGALALSAVALIGIGHGNWTDPFTRTVGFSLFPIAFAGVVLWVLRYGGSWLNWSVLQFVGKRSYGIYLLHYPVAMALLQIPALKPLAWHQGIRFIVIAGATTAIAALSWSLLEKPILKWKDRLTQPMEPRTGAVAA